MDRETKDIDQKVRDINKTVYRKMNVGVVECKITDNVGQFALSRYQKYVAGCLVRCIHRVIDKHTGSSQKVIRQVYIGRRKREYKSAPVLGGYRSDEHFKQHDGSPFTGRKSFNKVLSETGPANAKFITPREGITRQR